MEESEKQQLLARAQSLEKKQLFVKAAEIYLELGMGAQAASAYETCAAYEKAEALFKKLGKKDDAARCAKKRADASSSSGKSWSELQADFQQDKGNPY